MKNFCLLCLFFVALTSCGPRFLVVKDELVTKQRLASSFAKSPDPESLHFRKGKKLIVEWLLPMDYYRYGEVKLRLHLVYGNLEQKVLEYPIRTWAGFVSYLFLDPEFTEKKGIFTYKAEVITDEGRVLQSFQQQLWVQILDAKCEPQWPNKQINR